MAQESVAETHGWGTLPDMILCSETEVSFAFGEAFVPAPLCPMRGRCSGLLHTHSGRLASGVVDLGMSVFNNYGGLCNATQVLFLHTSRLAPSFGTARADPRRHGHRNILEVSVSYVDDPNPRRRQGAWEGLSLYAVSGDYFSGLYTTSALTFLGASHVGSSVGEVTALALEKVVVEDFGGAQSHADMAKLQANLKRLASELSGNGSSQLLDELQKLQAAASTDRGGILHVEEAAEYRADSQVPIRVRYPRVPREPVLRVRATAIDHLASSADVLKSVSFEVGVDKETVTVIAKSNRFQHMMGLVGSLGGYLAGISALFGCCFVPRRPATLSAKDDEELTLRGCSSAGEPLMTNSEVL